MTEEQQWELFPNSSFLLEGRTLVSCMDEIRALLNAERVDFDELRTRAQRLQALLSKAEGPA